MSLETIRGIILGAGWPVLVLGACYIYNRTYRFYVDLDRTPIARLISIFATTTVVTMVSLGLAATAFLMSDLENSISYILPIFLVWFVLMVIIFIHMSRLRKKAVEYNHMLTELDRAKTDFLAIVSHQLRTPLSGIKWTLDLLMRKKGELPADVVTKLDTIETSTVKSLHLISNLLNIVRIETGQVSLHMADVDIAALVQNIIHGLEPNAQKYESTIVFENSAPGVPATTTDTTLLGEVLKNIISNAIIHGDRSGLITVKSYSTKTNIYITVHNMGQAIPLERVKTIFERFSRNESNGTVDEIGGLGLYLSQLFMQMMGGSISVTSNTQEGTTFIIELPLVTNSKK
jgi:signal transduction histidine kinase